MALQWHALSPTPLSYSSTAALLRPSLKKAPGCAPAPCNGLVVSSTVHLESAVTASPQQSCNTCCSCKRVLDRRRKLHSRSAVRCSGGPAELAWFQGSVCPGTRPSKTSCSLPSSLRSGLLSDAKTDDSSITANGGLEEEKPSNGSRQEQEPRRSQLQRRSGRPIERSRAGAGAGAALDPEASRGTRIFVGNLPYTMTAAEVREFFRRAGPVAEVTLVPSKMVPDTNAGFGFVEFGGPLAKESALKAVRELDGVNFAAKRLTVRWDDNTKEREQVVKERQRMGGAVWHSDKRHDEGDDINKAQAAFYMYVGQRREDVRWGENLFAKIRKPNSKDYTMLIAFYARRKEKHKARAAFEQMRSVGIPPTVYSYTNLVQAYLNAGDLRAALETLDAMEEDGIKPSAVTYTVLLCYYGKVRDVGAAETVFAKMKAEGVAPSSNAYSALINVHCKAGNMESAESRVAELRASGMEPTVDMYNKLIDGYASKGEAEAVLDTFQALQRAGIPPNEYTYAGIIKVFVNARSLARAEEFAKEMVAADIPHNKVTLSLLITGCCRAEDPEKAYAYFQELLATSRPDVVAFTAVITAFAQVGQMERAEELLGEMIKWGIKPNETTWTIIIDGWGKLGKMNKVMEAVREMRAGGVFPTVKIFTCVIGALCKLGQTQKAALVVEEMKKVQVVPDLQLYTALMDGYARAGDVAAAFELFKKLKAEGMELDTHVYSTLINACCKVGRMQSALAVIGEMKAAGLPVTAPVYNTVLDGWARRGDVWEAADIFSQMEAEGIEPDTISFSTFINACTKAGDMERAMEAAQEMKARGIEFNIKTYTTIIDGWTQTGWPHRAYATYKEMRAAGIKPDYPVFHSTLSALMNAAADKPNAVYELAVELAKEMAAYGFVIDNNTAQRWKEQLELIEYPPGELAEAVQRLYPPSFVPLQKPLEGPRRESSDVEHIDDGRLDNLVRVVSGDYEMYEKAGQAQSDSSSSSESIEEYSALVSEPMSSSEVEKDPALQRGLADPNRPG